MKESVFIVSKKEAEKKALAITSEGMHFKGQYLPIENYKLFGKEVKMLDLAFKYVYWIEFNSKEYFISEYLILNKKDKL